MASCAAFEADVAKYTSLGHKKLELLRNLDLFVIDNSIRETTVGSLRGHTLENKRLIYEEVKKCNFQYFIIEAFNTENRVGDMLLTELIAKGEDLSRAVGFSEVWDVIKDKEPQDLPVPIGLRKCKHYGIKHVLFEIDLVYYKVDYEKFNMERVCKMMNDRIEWIWQNLGQDAQVFINLRDFGDAMTSHPERIWKFTNFLSNLKKKIAGLAYEDVGKYDKDLLGGWTRAVKNEMERCGWGEGQLIFHQHEQWGTMISDTMEVLAMGATGIWAGLCGEGAAMGHADSCTVILNLVRLGNKKVLEKFNCKHLRDAAINVTKIVTGMLPFPRQPVYGERAIDMVFGFVFSGIADNAKVYTEGFDLADFLGLQKTIRISNMANPEMILEKLKRTFGENPQFTLEMATHMKTQMLEDLKEKRKVEYNSEVGLAMLFNQAGGDPTNKMLEIIDKDVQNTAYINGLIDEIYEDWKFWDMRDGVDDDQITFDNFYKGFMAPYFGCYRCEDSQVALRCMDVDCDGMVDWKEFKVFLIWAGRQYPNVKNKQELLDKAFRNGLIPDMKMELDKARVEVKK